ncbi:MAG TPA: hypothetical protein VL332_09275 [Candidatus Saccharimonadaceae bacterium]|jgi:hypothetical protein|nr:hypothetical protein [Candidatus Saccharimonadaceae bacterium]
MTRPYVVLLVVAVVAAVALGVIGRRRPSPRAAVTAPITLPTVALGIQVRDGAVEPANAAVPKDHRVELDVVNRGRATVSVRLAGYEDHVAIDSLAAGASRHVTFDADRPGEDFAWLLDGRPVGRLSVTGSHLAEGRR